MSRLETEPEAEAQSQAGSDSEPKLGPQAEAEAQPEGAASLLADRGPQEHECAPTPLKSYDFRTGSELARESFFQLRIQCQRLCKVLGPVISAYLDSPAEAEMGALEPATLDQCLQNLPESSAVSFIEVAEHLSEIIWQIDGNLAAVIIGRMLGGPTASLARPPTVLEAALLGRFIQELMDVWSATWESLSKWQPTVMEVVGDITQVQTKAREEQVVSLAIRTAIGDEQGAMNVYLPVGTVERVLGREDATAQSPAASAPLVVGDTAGQVKVPLSVVVHQGQIALREAMQLGEGDVIALRKPLDAPLTVAVRGRPKFLAQAGTRRGHLAVRLLGPTGEFAP